MVENIPEVDRATEVGLEKNEFLTLGVMWIVKEDKFSFCFSSPPEDFAFTKRNVLKETTTIFDPFGFLTPYNVRAKLLMQEA